ncbi:putative quinol monooxygenase [Blastococcus sp. SYSU DS0510]
MPLFPRLAVLYTGCIQRDDEEARMFSLVVQMQVRPGKREEFLAGMAANAEASVRDEPGCLRFDVCAVEGDEHRFLLYELYTDAGAFEAHKRAPHFAQWRVIAGEVLAEQVNTPGQLLVSHSAEVAA